VFFLGMIGVLFRYDSTPQTAWLSRLFPPKYLKYY